MSALFLPGASPQLPVELWIIVFSYIMADSSNCDMPVLRHSLKAYCRVSVMFCDIARPLLFNRVQLDEVTTSMLPYVVNLVIYLGANFNRSRRPARRSPAIEFFTGARFRALLERSPAIGRFVQSLTLSGTLVKRLLMNTRADFSADLIKILPGLPNLKSFGLVDGQPHSMPRRDQMFHYNVVWEDIPQDIRHAMIAVFNLPTFESLDLRGIRFPSFSAAFSGISPTIRHLSLNCVVAESLVVGPHLPLEPPATITSLELSCIPWGPQRPHLISNLSYHFDITHLESLIITGLDEDDLWIDDLLKMQRDPYRLKHVTFHGILSKIFVKPA